MGDSLITAGILAVVALSEGVRRLSPGALVLQRTAFRPWRVARPLELGSDMRLTSWCIPLTVPLVLGAASEADDATSLSRQRLVTRLRARARRVQPDVAVLRIVGVVVLALLLSVPFATARWGGWGLLASVQLLLFFAITQAVIAWVALLRAGAPRRSAASAALKLLWPFSAQRGAQMVEEQVVAGTPPLLAAHTLLGDDALLRSLRPQAYDAVHGTAEESPLLELYDRSVLTEFIRQPIATDDQPYCPRCGGVYQSGVAECSDCQDVALVTHHI